jgi:signal peptidase I
MSCAPQLTSFRARRAAAAARPARPGAKRRALHIPATILIAALMVHALLIEQFTVTTRSMAPGFEPGRRVWVDKLTYTLRQPRRFELVAFQGPDGKPFLKRVVALPGESVRLIGGRLHIDGVEVATPVGYVCHGRHGVHAACRLAEDEFFVLGDNSIASDDSRTWPDPGVKTAQIIGRPIAGHQFPAPAAAQRSGWHPGPNPP